MNTTNTTLSLEDVTALLDLRTPFTIRSEPFDDCVGWAAYLKFDNGGTFMARSVPDLMSVIMRELHKVDESVHSSTVLATLAPLHHKVPTHSDDGFSDVKSFASRIQATIDRVVKENTQPIESPSPNQ